MKFIVDTEFPASLNKGYVSVVYKKRNGSPQEIRLRLEISIKDGDMVTQLHVAVLHSFLQGSSFIAIPILPDLVFYVYTFACPSPAFLFHQGLQIIIIIIFSQLIQKSRKQRDLN